MPVLASWTPISKIIQPQLRHKSSSKFAPDFHKTPDRPQTNHTKPKTSTRKMSDSKTPAASITTADGTVVTKSELDFLMACIQNTTGGQLVVSQLPISHMNRIESCPTVPLIPKNHIHPSSKLSKVTRTPLYSVNGDHFA
jgi:hypothetical protein